MISKNQETSNIPAFEFPADSPRVRRKRKITDAFSSLLDEEPEKPVCWAVRRRAFSCPPEAASHGDLKPLLHRVNSAGEGLKSLKKHALTSLSLPRPDSMEDSEKTPIELSSPTDPRWKTMACAIPAIDDAAPTQEPDQNPCHGKESQRFSSWSPFNDLAEVWQVEDPESWNPQPWPGNTDQDSESLEQEENTDQQEDPSTPEDSIWLQEEIEHKKTRLVDLLSLMDGSGHDPLPGGKFRLDNFLGDGMYGFVVSAWSFDHDKKVAIKFISKRYITHWVVCPEGRQIPLELSILRSFHHPNIIRPLSYYQNDRYFAMVTEFHGDSRHHLDAESAISSTDTSETGYGELLNEDPDIPLSKSMSIRQLEIAKRRPSCDLSEFIRCQKSCDGALCRRLFVQIASAVSYMHNSGWVHRDIKDANIVVDQNGNAKLVDFGAAAKLPTAVEDYFDTFDGTLGYTAPEILQGFRYQGPQADVWSLGVILHLMVFQQLPFAADDAFGTQDYTLVLPQKMEPKLANLLHKMLNPNVSMRSNINQIMAHDWVLQAVTGTDTEVIPGNWPPERLADCGQRIPPCNRGHLCETLVL